MTLIELPVPHRLELVWDAPNMRSTEMQVAGDGCKDNRLDFVAVGRFVANSAANTNVAAATVFVNVPEKHDAVVGLQRFVHLLRSNGFGVYGRPQIDGSDIDDNLVAHVAERRPSRLIIATHDVELIKRCMAKVGEGCPVTVLGYEENSAWTISNRGVDFVDLEDVPGSYAQPLQRSALRRLPPEGRFLAPIGPLPASERAVA